MNDPSSAWTSPPPPGGPTRRNLWSRFRSLPGRGQLAIVAGIIAVAVGAGLAGEEDKAPERALLTTSGGQAVEDDLPYADGATPTTSTRTTERITATSTSSTTSTAIPATVPTPAPTVAPTTPPTPAPTAAPRPTTPPATQPAYVAPPPPAGGDCTPGYDPCIPPGDDVDCAGGSGNGPRYVEGPVTVTGSDPYDLDRDGDGIGCEN